MPWTVDDVDGFKKGLSDAQKRRWVAIANGSLEDCQEAGGSLQECEASAIRIANAALNEAVLISEGLVATEEIHIDDEVQPLIEGKKGAVRTIRILAPGWGSSGYYSPQVIQAAAPQFADKKMFWNHPTPTEMRERPERDLNDLAGKIVGEPKYMEKGPKGPGLYGQAEVFSAFQNAVEELAPHIGVSINAWGKSKPGEAEGKKGNVVEAIEKVETVDFVTTPGAGGEVIALFEAARHQESKEETVADDNTVELKEVQRQKDEAETRLKEAEAKLTDLEAKHKDARLKVAAYEARDKAARFVKDEKLPGAAKLRVIEAAIATIEVAEDGSVDEGKLETSIKEAAKREADYLASVLGSDAGKVRGMGGETSTSSDTEKIQETLKESMAALGLDDKQAEIAARLR